MFSSLTTAWHARGDCVDASVIQNAMARYRPRQREIAIAVLVVIIIGRIMWSNTPSSNSDIIEERIEALLGARKKLFDAEFTTPSPSNTTIPRLNVTQYFCRTPKHGDVKRAEKFRQPIRVRAAWTSESDFTSRSHSTFSVVDKKDVYEMCDTIQVRIVAKNGRDEQKKYGGDYFRVRLLTNDHHDHIMSSMSDDEVIDHGDGTYTATITLKWPGDAVVRVYLVHSSEGVSVLESLRESAIARYSYKGTFCSQDGVQAEERECNVYISPKNRHICKFTDRRTKTSWYCLHPTVAGLNCSSWCRHRSDGLGARVAMLNKLTEKQKGVLLTSLYSNKQLHSTDDNIKVKPSDERLEELPPCKAIFPTAPLIAGYYKDEQWVSPHCNILRYSSSLPATMKCLERKTLFFLGDSTVKHLFDYFMKRYDKSVEIVEGNPHSTKNVGPLVTVDRRHDTHFILRSQGYPIGDSALYDTSDIQYVANVLDDIRMDDSAGWDIVVVISMWSYFTAHNVSIFEERMRDVVAAISRLHNRNPHATVVFNTPNTRDMDNLETVVYFSDWYARHLHVILREVLSGYERVGVLGAWDMTNAELQPHRLHPGGPHVQNLADQLLSYVCPTG